MLYIKTLLELYELRGYNLLNDDVIDFKYFLHCVVDKDENKIFVLADFNEKISVNIIKECISFITEFNSSHCIIIHSDNITHIVNKIINNSISLNIELFSEIELGYNVTKHILVPKHELCTDDEKKSLTYYINKIARIQSSDPVIKFHGFKKGQIVKITRKNNTIVFRLII